MKVELSSIRHCLDGAVPAAIATCSADGVPNVSYVSEVHYVDGHHVALSYQFFNKPRRNVIANGFAQSVVIDPYSGTQYLLHLRYLRTETSGPVFESMRVKLAGIAAHTGMTGVFRLLGSDIYEVALVEPADGVSHPASGAPFGLLPRVRGVSERLVGCADLETLIDALLSGLQQDLSIRHAMVFLHDDTEDNFYLIGSIGYPQSGIGSEIPFGYGIVGICGAERAPIRITHKAEEFRYSDAIRQQMAASSDCPNIETAIPLPGLEAPGSQLAVPVIAASRLLGVLYVESEQDGAFSYDSEDTLVTIANQFASSVYLLHEQDVSVPAARRARPRTAKKAPLGIRCVPENSSIFVDGEYLIKGVAGAIFWKLVRDYSESGRTEFSNRELRADPEIRLPEFSENLEARLVLLKRRLKERSRDIAIVPVARGKFRLDVSRPLLLELIDNSNRSRRSN